MIAEGIDANHKDGRVVSCLSELAAQLEKFWSIEEFDANVDRLSEEELCETHYAQNTTRRKRTICSTIIVSYQQ